MVTSLGKNAIKSLLLLIVVVCAFFFTTNSALAVTWDIVNIQTNVESSGFGTATITLDIPADISSDNGLYEFNTKEIPTDHNYWNLNNSNKCLPSYGGSSSFSAYTTFTIDNSVSNTDGTPTYADCSQSGNYYILFFNYTASSTTLYVASYYYNATIQQYLTAGEYGGNVCSTCSRIISTDPTYAENVGNPPLDVPYSINYYLTSFDSSETGTEYIKYEWVHALSLYNSEEIVDTSYATFEIQATTNGEVSFAIENLTATGTYNVNISMYRTVSPPWYAFWQDSTTEEIDSLNTYFIVGQETSQAEIDLAKENYINQPGAIESVINSALDSLLYTPPIGYATIVIDMFNTESASTTSALSITHNFPVGLPGEGNSITLDVGGGVSSTIAQIRQMNIATIDGDPFEVFMNYWTTLWYGVLGLWIVAKIFTSFNFSLERETRPHKSLKVYKHDYQKSGSINVTKG